MILCLDIGNTHIFGGVFRDDVLLVTFRYPSMTSCTSDQFGLFMKSVLRENAVDVDGLRGIFIASVLPSLDYSVNAACVKYFALTPVFLSADRLSAELTIGIDHPEEVGADRLANALGCMTRYPDQNCLIIDFGTATTICVLTAQKQFLGGVIMPGMRIAMEALHRQTAKLKPVDLVQCSSALGKNTVQGIQAGLYYGHLGGIKEILQQLQADLHWEHVKIVATGGYVKLFSGSGLFDVVVDHLVLDGLHYFGYQCALGRVNQLEEVK